MLVNLFLVSGIYSEVKIAFVKRSAAFYNGIGEFRKRPGFKSFKEVEKAYRVKVGSLLSGFKVK
jgi:hypothetical protein